jgi:hypothetical protein
MKIMLAPSTLVALFLIISILHCCYTKQGVIMWTGFIWLRTETGGGTCKNYNTTQGSKKGGEFLGLA